MQVRTYLAIGAWCVLGVALAQQATQTRRPLKRRPHTLEQRIDEIQSGTQKALENLTMTKFMIMQGTDIDGKPMTYKVDPLFGLRRTPTVALIHNGVLRETDIPIFPPFGVKTDLEVLALSRNGKPLDKGHLRINQDFGVMPAPLTASHKLKMVDFAEKAVPALKHVDRYVGSVAGFKTEARPLVLSKPECLPCHGGSKLGDTIAVLVFRMSPAKA